jgi:hypothetical protein
VPKNSQKCPKNLKIQSNFDKQAECDGVKGQSANAIRYKGVNKAKNTKGKTIPMRKNQNQKVSIRGSPVESPVSVEGKSPCGQVDLLKELDS